MAREPGKMEQGLRPETPRPVREVSKQGNAAKASSMPGQIGKIRNK